MAIPAIWLLLSDRFINQAFFDEVGWPNGVDTVARITAISIAAITVWEIADGFIKARRTSRIAVI